MMLGPIPQANTAIGVACQVCLRSITSSFFSFTVTIGRYANRIVNSTFTIDGVTSHIPPNENNNTDTLHGGPDGWDYRNFTVVTHTTDSITFSITDPDGDQGFPGQVIAYLTYTVTPYEWHERMVAVATEQKTPIMLSSHVYWNLDGYANNETTTALNHTLYMPYGGLRVGCLPVPCCILALIVISKGQRHHRPSAYWHNPA